MGSTGYAVQKWGITLSGRSRKNSLKASRIVIGNDVFTGNKKNWKYKNVLLVSSDLDWNALDDDFIEKIPEVDESVNPDTYDNAEDPRIPRPRGVRKSRRRRSSSRRRRG